MTDFLPRPWILEKHPSDKPLVPDDCLLANSVVGTKRQSDYAKLMNISITGRKNCELLLYPYPKNGNSKYPKCEGFPIRPTIRQHLGSEKESITEEAQFSLAVLKRMNETLVRVQELELALDNPENMWTRLRETWKKAEKVANPQMAEIVKQAQSSEINLSLRQLERKIRKILRRDHENVPVDRVQEIDRRSINWLIRQPGRNPIEMAGTKQRILAIVRNEDYNTLENRVLHSYVKLASQVGREWLLEHATAEHSQKFDRVSDFIHKCRNYDRQLTELEISTVSPNITPNYVLIHDKLYMTIFESWKKLLQHEKVLDDLWAWQAETWTDFVVLALVLAIDNLEEAEILAQSPIIWSSEATKGRWFKQENPFLSFWLKETNRIIEILSRPDEPGELLSHLRAHIAIKVTELSTFAQRKIAVWTPHTINRINLDNATKDATEILLKLQRVPSSFDTIKSGLIIVPGHERPEKKSVRQNGVGVDGIAFDASGSSLEFGIKEICDIVQGKITE